MQPPSGSPPVGNDPQNDPLPPRLEPPPIAEPPPLGADLPPRLPTGPSQPGRSGPNFVAVILSLCLFLFLADGLVSIFDDLTILASGLHILSPIRGLVSFFSLLLAILVYVMMAFTRSVPKRAFLPMTLFHPISALLVIPFAIYFYSRLQVISLGVSLCQFGLGLFILFWARHGWSFSWPLVPQERLGSKRFGWANLLVFAALNVFVLPPLVALYFATCASLAIGHFSEGFLALRPGGLQVQVRKYARADGKTIELVPMSHIGEPEFYKDISQAFPTNGLILMEGVSDRDHLLTNGISYHKMATRLGVSEQQHEFKPTTKLVSADIDINQFSKTTLGFLNFTMLVHQKGMTPELLDLLLRNPPPPGLDQLLIDDLLHKRNHHLLNEITNRLSESDHLIIPWGAAHIPEIAREIQKSGFHVVETHDYFAIRFGSHKNRVKVIEEKPESENPQK